MGQKVYQQNYLQSSQTHQATSVVNDHQAASLPIIAADFEFALVRAMPQAVTLSSMRVISTLVVSYSISSPPMVAKVTLQAEESPADPSVLSSLQRLHSGPFWPFAAIIFSSGQLLQQKELQLVEYQYLLKVNFEQGLSPPFCQATVRNQ